MSDRRPDPDALLAHLRQEEGERRRGRLKVFFGATAGVGKTYAMLEHAQARRREGVDVVSGVVETHGRSETEQLVRGLETLPLRRVSYRGVELSELDLDGALARHPALILVDELAHTNAPGSRHTKRWQDVEELLAAGIDVCTAFNVQHLESLNDVVARITHVRVRETVPDALLDEADEIDLIDLPPEQLLKRLAEGKVYVADQAERAIRSFFRPGNLIALRQLALRETAERVDQQMQVYRRAHAVEETWPVAERILVGVGPAPSSERLVRAAKRMADRAGAEWIAVFVETPASARWPESDRRRAWETLRLAERLGARAVGLSGSDTAAEILVYARAHNVTKLVVGKPTHPRWRDVLFGSKVDQLVRESGDIDVHVITGDPEPREPRPAASGRPESARRRGPGYLWALAGVAAATIVSVGVRPFVDPGNLIMTYLLVTVLAALRFGRGPSVTAAVIGVAAFDFFCVPPYYTFRATDTQYAIAFAGMLVVGLVISTLTARARDQAELSRRRERRTAALLAMSRDLVDTVDRQEIVRVAVRHVAEVFDARVAVLLPDDDGRLDPWTDDDCVIPSEQERAVAQWTFQHGTPAGAGTDTLPASRMLYLPLRGAGGAVGAVGVSPGEPGRFADPQQLHFLEAFADQMGASLERARLAEEALRARQLEDLGQLKSEFVAAASQELRAPLLSLAAHVEALGAAGPPPEHATDAAPAHLEAVREEASRMRTLLDELLDLSRMEAGRLRLAVRSAAVPDLVERALAGYREAAARQSVELTAEVPPDLAPVRADPPRIGTAIGNLVANALHATGPGGHVVVSADQVGRFVQISVADDGAGIPLQEQSRIFDRFVKVRRIDGSESTGLGLAIAREIVRAHRGAIWVDSGPGPGSVFSFTLPASERRDPSGP